MKKVFPFYMSQKTLQSRQEAEIPTLVQVDSHPQKGEPIINTIKNLTKFFRRSLLFYYISD